MRGLRRLACCALALGLMPGLQARGGGPWHIPHPHAEGTPGPGKARSIPHTHERAGWPLALGSKLRPSRTAGGIGSYVGGGTAWGRGNGRHPQDGTWGWDETGFPHFRNRALLGWSHGRRFQGGAGAYRTDGPHVPDFIAGFNSRLDRLHESDADH